MYTLVNSPIKNEGYILVAHNMTFKAFMTKTAQELGVKPPQKEAKSWLLQLLWRLDWLYFKLLGKRRRLSKQMVKTLFKVSEYDSSKITTSLNYTFKPIDHTIKDVSQWYLKDLDD